MKKKLAIIIIGSLLIIFNNYYLKPKKKKKFTSVYDIKIDVNNPEQYKDTLKGVIPTFEKGVPTPKKATPIETPTVWDKDKGIARFVSFECVPEKDYMAVNIIDIDNIDDYVKQSKQPNSIDICTGEVSEDNQTVIKIGELKLSCALSNGTYDMYLETHPPHYYGGHYDLFIERGVYDCGTRKFSIKRKGAPLMTPYGDISQMDFERIEIFAQELHPYPWDIMMSKGRYYEKNN